MVSKAGSAGTDTRRSWPTILFSSNPQKVHSKKAESWNWSLIFSILILLYVGGRRHEVSAFKSAAPLAESRAFEMLSADSCQFLSDSKSLCWPPPLPPTLPQICAHSPRGRPKPPTLSILSRLFAVRKLIKNQTPQKPSQNLKSRTPDRPNIDFGLAFGSPFGMEFSLNS